jgi:hypothetical protein
MRRTILGVLSSFLLVVTSPLASAAGSVRWGDFAASVPHAGSTTTVSLGDGSTVDITITTGGTQLVRAHNLGDPGIAETGLAYDSLTVFSIFNGGGGTTVPTTIVYSNFHLGASHVRGYLFLGGVSGRSSPITVTSSLPGAVATWPDIGQTFDLSPSETSQISWDPSAGQFTTAAPVGNDSRGIVVSPGDLRQYTSITISLAQHLDDTVLFSIGQETQASTGVRIWNAVGSDTWGRIKQLH